MALPELGSIAPDFLLHNQFGDKVSLEDYRNNKNVLLYFYPKAMTPGCTIQACGLRDSKEELLELQTEVIAISPDKPEKLLKFQSKERLNFTLLSDEDHMIAEKYGAWGLKKFMGKEYMGILRYTFIIDQNLRIANIMTKVKTKTHHDESIRWIKNNLLNQG